MEKDDFLDPKQAHMLSELECEFIAFFRALSRPEQEAILKVVFDLLLEREAPH